MGWFSKDKTEQEKAAEEVVWHRSSAKSCKNMSDTYSDLGMKKMSAHSARAASLHERDADEIESDGRVRGWW
ncbi:hypothetical protein DMP17_22340 [Pseudonocardia sp. TMWB2A]|uniref:hypothetical protein n=1 Tax=Pseudonocardia sp. TMWB2A TaxID=687430 RepID=UPI00307EFA7B